MESKLTTQTKKCIILYEVLDSVEKKSLYSIQARMIDVNEYMYGKTMAQLMEAYDLILIDVSIKQALRWYQEQMNFVDNIYVIKRAGATYSLQSQEVKKISEILKINALVKKLPINITSIRDIINKTHNHVSVSETNQNYGCFRKYFKRCIDQSVE